MGKKKSFGSVLLTGSLVILLLGSCGLFRHEEAGVKIEAELDNTAKEIEVGQVAYELADGMTKPIYSLEHAIVEKLYVETEVDSDRDGELDKVAITLVRPKTVQGVKVPTIYEMSPYHRIYTSRYMLTHRIIGAGDKRFIDNSTDMAAYYVQRGYAVVFGQSLGTHHSDGCVSIVGESEVLAAKAVIDWLNGSADAYTFGDKKVEAVWSTGNVAMSGASYDGSIAMAVAATGVEGLKTIVPVAAVSSWYDFYFENSERYTQATPHGLVEIVTNDKNPETCQPIMEEMKWQMNGTLDSLSDFWTERNFILGVQNIKASVLLGHGLEDWLVPTNSFDQYWRALVENKVTRKMVLISDGHDSMKIPEWRPIENKWLDHWLYGIENGIMEEPAVSIQNKDGSWTYNETWPDPEAKDVKLMLNENGSLMLEEGDKRSPDRKQILKDIDDVDELTLFESPEEERPYRLVYTTESLKSDIRLSGTPTVTVTASFERPYANLAALLIDYGNETPQLVTRGWITPQYRNANKGREDVDPSEVYSISWEMMPNSYVFKNGHQIGLVLISTDPDFTFHPASNLTTTVTPGLSELILPLVGDGL